MEERDLAMAEGARGALLAEPRVRIRAKVRGGPCILGNLEADVVGAQEARGQWKGRRSGRVRSSKRMWLRPSCEPKEGESLSDCEYTWKADPKELC